MENHPELPALLQRLQVLERRQQQWSRLALVLVAVGLLAFVGWAPFDNVPTAPDTGPRTPAAAEPTPATTPKPTAEEAPSVADILRDDGDEPQDAAETPNDFQPYTHREGDETFLPTRLEWLSLRASAELPRGGRPNDGYGIMFGPDGKGSNTIRVLCTYDAKRVNRKQMEADLQYIQVQLAGLAQLHGWGWLKVRIEARALN